MGKKEKSCIPFTFPIILPMAKKKSLHPGSVPRSSSDIPSTARGPPTPDYRIGTFTASCIMPLTTGLHAMSCNASHLTGNRLCMYFDVARPAIPSRHATPKPHSLCMERISSADLAFAAFKNRVETGAAALQKRPAGIGASVHAREILRDGGVGASSRSAFSAMLDERLE
ncbi:hypothetical protein CC80DRAFT_191633 [Byssothecium circinans]|uniref:Uncharacterized protein n=1 Tax=Byssothecium circinans TaxID=147558 RepID=A0A6A5TH54_9PLEO|nr:hypothetical protein CC80DRAFT_191633 [Byssothecium circinans]